MEVNAGKHPVRCLYRHTQIGWTILISVLAVWVLFLPVLPEKIVFSVILALVAVLFGSLTVIVEDNELRWYFGPGLIRKRQPVQDIAAVEKAQNKWWWGYGIRFHLSGFWIYNVSGRDSVEILLKNGRRFRIGTDQPNHLRQAIVDAVSRAR